MKKAVRVIFIIMLMLVTALTFVYIAMLREKDTNRNPNIAETDKPLDARGLAAQGRSLVIDGECLVLQVGQSHQCSARLDDGSKVRGIIWSSTDDAVAEVDAKGRVTALTAGSSELWAVVGKNLKTHVTVIVYEDVDAAAFDAVVSLATDGSDDSMKQIETLAQGLSHSKSKQIKKTAEVMKTLTEFKKQGWENGDAAPMLWDELVKAVIGAGFPIDENLLRQAALSAYCQGEKASSDFTISFTGDCTFAYFNGNDKKGQFPSVYRNSGSVSYPFDLTRCVFGADDLTMINFEGALTESRQHKQKQFYFRGDPSYVNILTSSSVEAVTLENNHSFDYFDSGFNDTLDIMRQAGVRYTSYYSPAVVELNNCRVVMLSMCLIGSEYTDEFREHVEDYVNRYRSRDTLIVMNVHWGEEKASQPAPYQIEAAHAMIDCGVDLIIGHHSHVLQGIEQYDGHYIAYSLGNFSFGGNTSVSNPSTVILRASFSKSTSGRPAVSRLSMVPCLTTSTGSSVNNYQPTPVYGEKAQKVSDYLLELSAKLDGGIQSVSRSMIP
jgi:Putative enzyme of poly-gamma-glutamate biosynthesis (capsule formation)